MHPSPVNLVKEFEEFTHKKHEQKHLEEGNQNPGNGGGRSGSGDGTESENVNQLHTLLLSSTGGPEVVLLKVPSEFYLKVCNHGEGPY